MMAENNLGTEVAVWSLPKVLQGRYEDFRIIGQGAMGIVYAAKDRRLGRQVAIKTIHWDSAGHSDQTNAELKRRLELEAAAATKVTHPNVVTIYDMDFADQVPYIVMEYVDGHSLYERLGLHLPMAEPDIKGIVQQLCSGLKALHDAGIIHRDVKPANIMLSGTGNFVKIMDFGIARLEEGDLTRTGSILGTISYMSPEQLLGRPIDGRSDIFSLGCVIYEMATGERPFPGRRPESIMYNVMHETPAKPSGLRPGLTPFWDDLINKCLGKDANQRYQNCGKIITDMDTRPPDPQPGDETISAAVQSAVRKVGESPLMIGEVQWLLGIVTLGFAYLLIPYAIIREFVNAAAKAAGRRGQELRDQLDTGQGPGWRWAFHLSWASYGIGLLAAMIFLYQNFGLWNLAIAEPSKFLEHKTASGIYLYTAEVGLIAGAFIFLLWFMRTASELDERLTAYRKFAESEEADEHDPKLPRKYYQVLEFIVFLVATGLLVQKVFWHTVNRTNEMLQRINEPLILPSAGQVYIVEIVALVFMVMLIFILCMSCFRFIVRDVLLTVIWGVHSSRRMLIWFHVARVTLALTIFAIPLVMYRRQIAQAVDWISTALGYTNER